jgi:histidinol dehydrogenase
MLEVLDGRAQATPVHIPRPRPVESHSKAAEDVAAIVEDVRLRGDEAIFDRRDPIRTGPRSGSLRVPEELIGRATSLVRPGFVNALEVMEERLRRTCERQVEAGWLERGADELVGELVRPLRRVGVHVPGGRHARPSSIVMAVVPAQVAGVEGIAIAAAPGDDGEVPESVLAVCAVLGVTEVYRIGGPGAIAALAHGTESVRPVEKIVGPDDAQVRSAKRLVRGWVGVDADAGSAELAIVAGESASPLVLAADLIAQAEHGPNGAHVLITWEPALAEQVISSLDLQVAIHERSDDVENALIEGGRAVLVRDLDHALDTANAFAPQRLQLHIDNAVDILDRVRNAGSIFVGPLTAFPAGDYVGGTNRLLPSGGSARWSSGLSVRDFIKRTYVSGLDRSALERLAPHIDALAETEGLHGHARAVHLRLDPPATGEPE